MGSASAGGRRSTPTTLVAMVVEFIGVNHDCRENSSSLEARLD